MVRLIGKEYDAASVAAVCEGERLVGLVTIERLLSAPRAATVASIMNANAHKVTPDTHQERAAWAAFHNTADRASPW